MTVHDALSPDCYVCRLMRDSLVNVGKDAAYIVGFVTGYAEAATRHTIDWVVGDMCKRHEEQMRNAVASVSRQLRGKEAR